MVKSSWNDIFNPVELLLFEGTGLRRNAALVLRKAQRTALIIIAMVAWAMKMVGTVTYSLLGQRYCELG